MIKYRKYFKIVNSLGYKVEIITKVLVLLKKKQSMLKEAAVHFIYGNLNYQQQAMMNSVTNGQVANLAQSMPGVDYFDRALELFKNTRSGWFTLSHTQ